MKSYDKEFKEEAVKLAKEIGAARAVETLGITKSTLYTWISLDKKTGEIGINKAKSDNAPDTFLWILQSADGGVKENEKAAGEVLHRGEKHDEHQVGITMRFGSAEAARQCAKAILYAGGVERDFPSTVKEEAQKAKTEGVPPQEMAKRVDLRSKTIFTIDAASTKDIDDAISAEKTPDGYCLGVHIADVSYYVKPKSEADIEAFKRGTSIYYADSVIPMLPAEFSNGVCSLNPQEDRLAFSCWMHLDHAGRLLDYQFEKTVICSCLKGVYDEINQLFAGQAAPAITEKYAEVQQSLQVMQQIYKQLATLRAARGSMEIESDEPLLILNKEGRLL